MGFITYGMRKFGGIKTEVSKIKKVLIIVPHQDDECNVAGTMIYDLRNNDVEVFVTYTTNGDYYPWMARRRLNESISALGCLGVDPYHIIFLGYGSGGNSKKHIYNTSEFDVVPSSVCSETYGLKEYPDYCFINEGRHNKYNRHNFKADLKKSIISIKADCIICVDFDSHPDHRATSLIFEEVMKELIFEKEYRPIILKKFAYASIWEGRKDYYLRPFRETLKPERDKLIDQNYELDNPAYSWADRIRFDVDDIHKKDFVIYTPVFRAMRKHKTQLAWYNTLKIVNDDIIFWWRNTSGLQYKAEITASSGNSSYLNDFKYIDCTDVSCKNKGYKIFDNCVWVPKPEDKEKTVTIKFDTCKKVSQISLFENFDPNSHINNIEIIIDNKTIINTNELNNKGTESKFIFPNPVYTDCLQLRITSCYGPNPGLTEIEVYEEVQEFDYTVFPISRYKEKKRQKRHIYLTDYLLISCMYLLESRLNPFRINEIQRQRKYNRVVTAAATLHPQQPK